MIKYIINNLRLPEKLRQIPRRKWPNIPDRLLEVWRSKNFMVQVYDEPDSMLRLSIIRTELNEDQTGWAEGISWDELQELKKQCGRGDRFAVEIFPRDKDVVNVANMRHLWVFPQSFKGFGWIAK